MFPLIDWFITILSSDGQYLNFQILKNPKTGKFEFSGDNSPEFDSIEDILVNGKGSPFNVSRRLTPCVVIPTRTKVFSAGENALKNMVPERIDLPSHALYPESKVTSKSVMGAGRFTDVYQGRMQIEATKKERLVVTKCIKNDDLLRRRSLLL